MANLSRFLFNYRVTAQETTGVSPAELMFDRRQQTKLDLLQPNIEGKVQKRQEAMKNRYNQNTKLRQLPSGVAVYTRLSSNENWQPATVIESKG